MSIKLIHFRNKCVSFFEGYSFEVNTRAKEFSFKPADGEEEGGFSAGFHEIYVKQTNIICIFDSKTNDCRLAAIYLDQRECDGDFDFIERKTYTKIDENQEKNLYKNNFILFLIGILIDQPLTFTPALKNVLIQILGLTTTLPLPIIGAHEIVNISVAANSNNIVNNETPPTKLETRGPSLSPTNVSMDLPPLSSANNSSTTSSDFSRREEFGNAAAPIGIPTTNEQQVSGSSSRNSVNKSYLPQLNQSPSINGGLSSISHAADDIISNLAFRQQQPRIPVASAAIRRTRTSVVHNNVTNSSKAPPIAQRKRMRSNDFDWSINFGSNVLNNNSVAAENAPKKRKNAKQINAAEASRTNNDKVIHLPNYFFKNVSYARGKKLAKHLFIISPNNNTLAYEYQSMSESKGEYRCIKCFKNKKMTVSAKFNSQFEVCTLGRNNHQCEAQICVRDSTDTTC